jgi:regulator of protease activity HflC (stomatin/prohibitin superfamily)
MNNRTRNLVKFERDGLTIAKNWRRISEIDYALSGPGGSVLYSFQKAVEEAEQALAKAIVALEDKQAEIAPLEAEAVALKAEIEASETAPGYCKYAWEVE